MLTLAALVAVCGLAWLYIVTGAGSDMSAREMTTAALFPHQASHPMGGMGGSHPSGTSADHTSGWLLTIGMWWVMMIAMMTPSATPAILLYARVHRHSVARGERQGERPPTGSFAAGYLLVWLAFSVAAAILHLALEEGGLISALGSRSRWLSAGILISAGIYQLSPLKTACLSHCRSPAEFLSRHWRPGASGALRLGVRHGAYCVGCCWVLMALLFVGGAMNLIWIAALGALVMVEKLVRGGSGVGRTVGVILVGWGLATLAV
jgi:predicted metal-binding membrane protein